MGFKGLLIARICYPDYNFVSEYKEAFNLYDKDKDGIIATQKLGRVLRAMGLNPTEIEIQEMIDEIDSEGKCKRK